ncbi:N-glycosylase/DNA lyase [Halopiger aswanensis]|uniref:N-glycosylase/DNA lyase n=1 Tax=Halopiger aswanensis TaxID=148449 RepID=A0A419VVW3_9EURY|nr:N-glycosylase/DNA lyase [Halopiger aswanensis]RKD86251.1 N-glycosylase/DNA lyase [Halopiger aswanensis]
MTNIDRRRAEVAEAIAGLGYDGIIRFDESEPEYEFLIAATEEFESTKHLALLTILATTQDYQLNGDAQRFWETLEETLQNWDTLDSESTVNEVLAEFMEQPVNARLRDQKQDRLVRMIDNGFGEWFLTQYPEVDPYRVWEEIAEALETTMDKKTVVLAVKAYDEFNLIVNGEYLDLPTDVPIPCDLQVKRVARAAGIVEDESTGIVMDAWADVMDQVNAILERPVSMFRVDSIVWQAGQIISDHNDQKNPSQQALRTHFKNTGLSEEQAQRLAREFTITLSA